MNEIDKRAVKAMNEIWFKIMGYPEKDRRRKCWACDKRLDKGEGRIFQWATLKKDGKTMRSSGMLYCKHRENCSKKSRWTKAHKEHKEIINERRKND